MSRSALSKLCKAVKTANLADLPVSKAIQVLADMPEAKAFQLMPDVLRQMLLETLPEQYATFLLERAGFRVGIPLADLAYLAKYDQTLTEIAFSVILYLDSR